LCFSLVSTAKKEEGFEKFAGRKKIKGAFHSPQALFIKDSSALSAEEEGVSRLALFNITLLRSRNG
jgi:hypothetical protein